MAAEITTNLRLVSSNSVHVSGNNKQDKSDDVSKLQGRQELPGVNQAQSNIAVEKTNPESTEVAEENLDQAVDEMNTFTQNLRRELKFTIDKESGQTIITVIDSESQQVVRQIPREEVMDVMKSLKESSALLAGIHV